MSSSPIPLLLSLKPHYADLVFAGSKKVELRRRFSQSMQGRCVFVYATSPTRTVRGRFKIGQVWRGTPAEIWSLVRELAGIEKPEFDDYYAGCEIAYALEITDVWECPPLTLDVLKRRLGTFVAPQSWRYVKPHERELFQQLELHVDPVAT